MHKNQTKFSLYRTWLEDSENLVETLQPDLTENCIYFTRWWFHVDSHNVKYKNIWFVAKKKHEGLPLTVIWAQVDCMKTYEWV